MATSTRTAIFLFTLLAVLTAGAVAYAARPVRSQSQQLPISTAATASSTFTIPRVATPRLLEDFVEMRPVPGVAQTQQEGPGSRAGRSRGLAWVEDFTQRFPRDGEPATQPVDAVVNEFKHRWRRPHPIHFTG